MVDSERAQTEKVPVINDLSTEAAPVSRFRWVICSMLFAATAINYMDRQVLGILVLTLQRELGWSEAQYGFIITGFQLSYAFGLIFAGSIIDRIGTRIGYVLAMSVCSVAAVAHALVRSVAGFGGVRLLLGLGEAGNFPVAVKTTSEWFPENERAFAVGLFNSGSTVGAILAPMIVPWIALSFGWRTAFALIGLLGFIWIPIWLFLFRKSVPASKDVGESEPAISIGCLLRHKETWAFLVSRSLTEPVWWFYLY
jgi:MFS transporter, ACS family, hexuronate transporter